MSMNSIFCHGSDFSKQLWNLICKEFFNYFLKMSNIKKPWNIKIMFECENICL